MARGARVQVVADGIFEHFHLHTAVGLVHTDTRREEADALGRVAAPAQPGDGRHARVIPTADEPFFHQLQQLAFAHDRVVEHQPRKLVLVRTRLLEQGVEQPVIDGPVVLEFQGADRSA